MMDPFLCQCKMCRRFWMGQLGRRSARLLRRSTIDRACDTAVMLAATRCREDHPAVLRLGDRVTVKGEHKGVVKYVGVLDEDRIAPETYVGVQLDENVGSPHNGVHKGRRYFHCPRGHGMLVRYSEVIRTNPPEKRPMLYGNDMFPSYRKVKEKRRLQAEKEPVVVPQPPHASRSRCRTPSARSTPSKLQPEQRSHRSRSSCATQQDDKPRPATPSRDYIYKWKDRLGGGKLGERKARTLYKLELAFEAGTEYMRQEQQQEQQQHCDSEDCDTEDERTWPDMGRSMDQLKARSRAKKLKQLQIEQSHTKD